MGLRGSLSGLFRRSGGITIKHHFVAGTSPLYMECFYGQSSICRGIWQLWQDHAVFCLSQTCYAPDSPYFAMTEIVI